MPRRDRDFEPGRRKNGGPLVRRFFSLLGLKSGRERIERREREAEADSETVDLRGKAREQLVSVAIPGSGVITRSGTREDLEELKDMTEEIPFIQRCEDGQRSYDVLFHVKDESTEITVSTCAETPEEAVNDAIERVDVPQGELLLDRGWSNSHGISEEQL